MAAQIGGFDSVHYDDWESLLERLWREAPASCVVALDEFPEMVQRSPELPSLLQKKIDAGEEGPSVILAGSSQRMMHGLVLDGSAPLYGRAREILPIKPLGAAWIAKALGVRSAASAVEHYSVWGGVPRYWELASQYRDRRSAVESLVLDPLGVLHHEPDRLLRDDLQDVARAASILSLIGRGCHRVSEIAARLQLPATSLSRPLARLVDLDLIRREVPFDRSFRDTKRTYYRIADPFLCFWYRFVDPNRSRLEAGPLAAVAEEVEARWVHLLADQWEELCRRSVSHLRVAGEPWNPASRWWGRSRDGTEMEFDLVAKSSTDPNRVLVGEVKVSCTAREVLELHDQLVAKAKRCPPLVDKEVVTSVWVLRRKGKRRPERTISAEEVLAVLT